MMPRYEKARLLERVPRCMLRARRHRVRPNLDREWYHVMAASALEHHWEQVPQ